MIQTEKKRDNFQGIIPVTNAHLHLELTGLSSLYSTGPGKLRPWMHQVFLHLKQLSNDQIRTAVELGIRKLKSAGTTHVCDVSASWQSLRPLQESGLQGIVYLEVRGLDQRKALGNLEKAKSLIHKERAERKFPNMSIGLFLHSPYSCHPALLKRGAAWCKAEEVPLSIHVGESPREQQWIRQAKILAFTGTKRVMRLFAAAISRLLPKQRPVSYLDSLDVLSARPLLIHCTNLSNGEISRVAESGCAVVHCPRSNERLSCGRMPLERFLFAGIRVYMGTDSNASCPDLNVYEEAAYARNLHSGFVANRELNGFIHRSLLSLP